MKILFIINDAPYGTEKAYNAFRMAMSLQKEHSSVEVLIFLMADAVPCALPNQATPRAITTSSACSKPSYTRAARSKPVAPVPMLGAFEIYR